MPEHHPALYRQLALDREYRHTFLKGRVLPYEEFVASLWSDVLLQYLITDTGGEIGAVVRVCQASFRHATARVEFYVLPEYRLRGWPLEGLRLTLDEAFRDFSFRKIYAEVLAPAYERVESGAITGRFGVEAILTDHDWWDGRWVDRYVLGIYPRPGGHGGRRPGARARGPAMGLAELASHLGEVLRRPIPADPATRLVDVPIDSLDMCEIVLALEDLGAALTEAHLADLQDLSDLHHWYLTALGHH